MRASLVEGPRVNSSTLMALALVLVLPAPFPTPYPLGVQLVSSEVKHTERQAGDATADGGLSFPSVK